LEQERLRFTRERQRPAHWSAWSLPEVQHIVLTLELLTLLAARACT